MKKPEPRAKLITNKKARFDYEIEDTLVAGIVLTGAETKSLRMGQGIIRGSFVSVRADGLWLNNMQINPLQTNLRDLPEETRLRARKLLVTANQTKELTDKKNQGYSIVPTKLLTETRHIKIELGIGHGKKKYDKRQAIKKRDEQRNIRRSLN